MTDFYTQGFVDKCAEHGVDPEQLVKLSGFIIPSWGGASGLTNQGVGLEGGWAHMLGAVPFPYAGIRAGGEGGGVSIGGPIPMLGIDTGRKPGWSESRPRSIWKILKDKISEIRSEKHAQAASVVPQQKGRIPGNKRMLTPNPVGGGIPPTPEVIQGAMNVDGNLAAPGVGANPISQPGVGKADDSVVGSTKQAG
jgi:hypothetical protein